MEPERWQRLKEIFHRAMELNAGERQAFLEQACAGDLELRAEVDRLLREEPATDTAILEQPRWHVLARGDVVAGRFAIVRFMGQGGMGEVFEAEDRTLGGSVALKTLRPALAADPLFLARFRREVQIARQITHRNVCRVFDFGQTKTDGGGDLVFLTMELLEGETLGMLMRRRGSLPPHEALPIVRQIADGMTALHESGVVHRDFKPGNVILARAESGAPRAVITDFGVARGRSASGAPETLNPAGYVLGTPDYMAPEQLRGAPASPASDIYALGLVMYEMVTGRKAFPGGAAVENAVQRATGAVMSPRQIVPALDPRWETAILGCLTRDPEQRLQTPAAVVQAIEGVPQGAAAVPGAFRRTWVFGAVAVFFLATLSMLWRYPIWKGSGGPADGARHVAVLPFKVLGDDAGLQVFADGLMETITSRLSQYESGNTQLTVVPASEVRAQKAGVPADARRTFAASMAVEGRVQSQEGRVRLILTVIDTARMVQADSIVVENNRSRAFDLQDEAVIRLASSLSLRAVEGGARETAALRALSPGAYDYYLQAAGYLQRNDKIENIDSAITLLDRALATDPNYAAAWAALGQAYWLKYDRLKEPIWITKAVDSCNRAVRADADLPATHVALGRIRNGTGNYEQARQEYARALALEPRSHEAFLGLASAYFNLNRFAEAEATYKQAIALRPGDWIGYKELGGFYYRREDFDNAIRQYQEVIRLTPDNALGYVNLGVLHVRKGETAAARKAWERALELDPGRLSTLTNLGNLALQEGDNRRAIGLLESAVKVNDRSHLVWSALARAYRGIEGAKSSSAARRAVELMEAEVKVNPNNADFAARLLLDRVLAGQTADFQMLLDRASKLAADNPSALADLAEACHYLGDTRQAHLLLRTAMSKGLSKETIRQNPALRALSTEIGTNP